MYRLIDTPKNKGVYGWLTVNYLINGKNLAAENQVGSLDWGGGSSEITFASSQRNQNDNSDSNSSGSKLEIFSRSDECFGQSKVIIPHSIQKILKNTIFFLSFRLWKDIMLYW